MLVKLGKGALAKAEDVRTEMCAILGPVKGGEGGRTPAARAATPSNQPRQVDAQVALRPGERIKLTGAFAQFCQFERVMLLKVCKPE